MITMLCWLVCLFRGHDSEILMGGLNGCNRCGSVKWRR